VKAPAISALPNDKTKVETICSARATNGLFSAPLQEVCINENTKKVILT
jgi:hypothetical protein